jgi:hypothetical protein
LRSLLLLLDGCEKFAGESKLSAAPRGRSVWPTVLI